MQSNENNRFITIAIIIVSLAAIMYFGLQAISDNSTRTRSDQFEYSVEKFKKQDKVPVAYSQTEKISVNYHDYFGITIDEKDNLYLAVDKKIVVFNKERKIINEINLSEPAYCLEADKQGNLYAGMADHIEVYTTYGKKTNTWKSLGSKAIITSLAVTEEAVFAADAGNLVVWKFDKSGKITGEIGRKDEKKDVPGYVIPSPYFDVDIDPEGFLWAANTGRHQLENYTPEGSIRTAWGVATMQVEGFSGCCNPSHFVILPNGSFITAEKGIVRIKEYDHHGVLRSLVAEPKDFEEGTVDLDLAIDSKNKIYVLDESRKAIRVFRKNHK